MVPEIAPGIVEASGVLVGLVIVAIMTIRAGSLQSKASAGSMERVVELMAKSLRDDLRSYQSQMHADSRATMSRVEALDARMNEITRALTETREDLGDRLRRLEREIMPTPSRQPEHLQ